MIAFIKHRGTETQRGGIGLCPGFKEALAALCLCVSVFNTSSASAETYVGLSGSVLLPQGGSRMHHVGGAALRVGSYVNENWAVEGEAAWLENVAGLSAQMLGHLQGWDFYGNLFGYSRFDPFVTLGAKGWIGHGCGQVGPKAGLGAFYHLTDNWSLRADADATLGLETNCEMLYSISIGFQYAF